MIKRLVGWFLLLPLAAVLVLFALANRHMVQIGLDPLGRDPALLPTFDLPLFAVIYTMLIIGVLMGGAAVWVTQGRNRRERRRLRRETERLAREVEALRRPQNKMAAAKGAPAADDLLEIE